MRTHLENKVVLITGSTLGIGKAIARGYLEEGAIVVINGRNPVAIKEAIEDLSQYAAREGSLYGVAADLGSDVGIQKFIDQVAQLNLGPVDILVNNMSYYERRPFFDITTEEYMRMFQTNVLSAFKLSQEYLKSMLERNSGSILIISSEAGYCPKDFMVHYSSTKAAQFAVSRGIAELTKGTRVRVNVVSPGPTKTEGVISYLKTYAQEHGYDMEQAEKCYIQQVEPTSLIQRFATPEEVANVAVFLGSDLASAVNGQNYLVEGGIVRHI